MHITSTRLSGFQVPLKRPLVRVLYVYVYTTYLTTYMYYYYLVAYTYYY
jgi:hypothetical protein